MSPRRATNHRGEYSSPRRPVRSKRVDRCSRSPPPPDSGANQGALFRPQGNRPWPHCGPTEHPTVPILQQPDPRKLGKCSEFLDSGEWAIQDSNLGPLPYQENLLSPPVSQLELNPLQISSRRVRKATGEDWSLQAGGPIVAPRRRFEGRVSFDPEAVIMPTIRSSPDAREAGRCAPAGSRRPPRASARGRARPSRARRCRWGSRPL